MPQRCSTFRARVGLAAVVLCVALGVVAASRTGPRAAAAFAAPEPVQLDRLKSQADEALRIAKEAFATPPSEVVHADALIRDMRATLLALVSIDADRYFDFRLEEGASFKREYAQGLLDQLRDRKVVSSKAPPQATDRELFAALWNSAPERRMSIGEVLPGGTRAGRGTVFLFGDGEAWPYSGAQFASSVFCPRAGPFSQETGERLDGTDRSAHLLLFVELADGSRAHHRLNYFYDDEQQRWFPVTIAAGSDATDHWPWPLF